MKENADIVALIKRLKEVLYPEFESKDCCIILSRDGDIKLFTSNGETALTVRQQPSPTMKPTEKQLNYLRLLFNDVKFPENKKKEYREQWPPKTQEDADVWIKYCIKVLAERKRTQHIKKNPNAGRLLV